MLTVQCAMVHLLLDCLKYASTLCGHCINQSGAPIEIIGTFLLVPPQKKKSFTTENQGCRKNHPCEN